MGERVTVTQYTEDQRDCLQEICNIATGQAADVLARKLNAFVTLPIPSIQIIDVEKLPDSLNCFNSESRVYTASQRFVSCEDDFAINGFALVLLSEQSVADLNSPDNSEEETVQEICKSMAQACLEALSEQWEMTLRCEISKFVDVESFEAVCASQAKGWKKVLMVEIHYQLEDSQFEGDLLLLFPDQAIVTLADKLDDLLDF